MKGFFVRFASVVALLTGSGLAADHALAQPPETMRWMLTTDLGGGSASLTTRDLTRDRELGGAFGFGGAFVFKPDLALGAAMPVWFGDVADTSYFFGVLGPSLAWWPGQSGFSLRAVLGFGFTEATGGVEWSDSGVGGFAAAAYEFTITRTVKFGPQLSYMYITTGDDSSADVVGVSFLLNWYPAAQKPPEQD